MPDMDDETQFGGVPMGNPQDPSEHPVNNIAPKDTFPLQNSGQAFAGEAMPHGNTRDAAKHVGGKKAKLKKK
jgi:hypothetical protein